jgi:fatty-acid desaturase
MSYHRDQYLLFMFQCLAHLGLLTVFVFGTWTDWLIVLAGFFMLGCLGVTITYHRLLSHKSWNSPYWFKVLGIILGNLSLIGSSIAWTALHRQHHRYTDQTGDPHSPKDGFLRAQWGTIFETPNIRYVPDLLREPLHVWFHKHYFLINLLVLILLFLIHPMLAATLYLAPAALVFTIGGANNSIAHSNYGYRNYNTNDNSHNIPLLGILMWGEGWHNNHHSDPANYNFSRKWWEFDLGGWIIKRLNT